ncbi:MAG TPA: trigger factor [Nocardioidaceae bacterium]|nr:trigger factor [Nocardioidaceae bacterium]
MKSAVESLNPTRVKLTVEVPFEELRPSLDAAYKKISKQINVPGFRRGKVPVPVIDQRVGRQYVVGEAVNEALPGLYAKALQDNNITPLSQPELQLDEVADGRDLSFTAELDVKPAITLPAYAGLEAEVDEVSVTDADVDEQLQGLRERFGTLTAVERPAADGDFVTIDLAATKDGTPIEEARATGTSYRIGRRTMLEGLDEALVGLSAGEERTFSSTLVGGEYKDQPVDVTVKVSGVKEQVLPEVDDEFAQLASEFDTVAELRDDLRDKLAREARLEQSAAAREALLQQLLGLVDVPLPDSAVAAEVQGRRDQLAEQLSAMGLTRADYLEAEGQTDEEYEAALDKRVRESMAAQFVLDEIADAESVGVDQRELTEHMVRQAQLSGVSPQEYANHMVEHNHLPQLVGEVRRSKALEQVLRSAVVRDLSGNVLELERLQPDGSIAEEERGEEPESAPEPDSGEAPEGAAESTAPAASES